MAARHDPNSGIHLLGGQADHQVLAVIAGDREHAARRFDLRFLQDIVVAAVAVDVHLVRMFLLGMLLVQVVHLLVQLIQCK